MQKKFKIIAAIVAGLIVVSILYLCIARNNPILYRSEDRSLAEPNTAFIIQNPFRERGPEDEAENLLQDLKAGNCEKTLKLPAMKADAVTRTCEREGVYPLLSWSITDRQDIGKQSILVYRVYRNVRESESDSVKSVTGLVWIDVEKIGEGRWRVLSYQTYY